MPPEVRAYEHIGGARGARIRYRAPRFGVKELFGAGPFPVAIIGGRAHILSDLSASGLSAFSPKTALQPSFSESDIAFSLQFGDAVLHAGEAGLARVENTDFGPKIGLEFRKEPLNIDTVVGRYHQELARSRLRLGLGATPQNAPIAFRALCSDMLLIFRNCRDVLNEERYGKIDDPDALIGECLENLSPLLAPLIQNANGLVEDLLEDPAALGMIKRIATQLLTPDFVVAPLWARAVEKPLGYPGDFELVRSLHEPAAATGPSYIRLLERFGRGVFGWVPNRSKLIVDALAREIAHFRGPETLQIASIGAGAGEELRGLISRGRTNKPLSVSLLDQDEAALARGYSVLQPEALSASAPLTLTCLNASHAELFDGGELEQSLGNQHVFVVPALLDYLRHRTATQLLDALYDRIVPGGVIFAACLRQHEQSARWASELICDWSMIHRTKDEALALAAKLHRARIDARLDRGGDVYLLVIRKPRAE